MIVFLVAGGFDTGFHNYGTSLTDNLLWKQEDHSILHYGVGWVSMADVGMMKWDCCATIRFICIHI